VAGNGEGLRKGWNGSREKKGRKEMTGEGDEEVTLSGNPARRQRYLWKW